MRAEWREGVEGVEGGRKKKKKKKKRAFGERPCGLPMRAGTVASGSRLSRYEKLADQFFFSSAISLRARNRLRVADRESGGARGGGGV